MKRREFITLLGGAATWPREAWGQQVSRVRRIGVLLPAAADDAEFQAFAIILPALGMLSMPISYLLLEQLKWSLVPQLQPMRVLLFVTAFTVILASIAALKSSHSFESAAWFALG